MIGQDDGFSHEDGEGELFWRTGGGESLVEMLENGVMPGGQIRWDLEARNGASEWAALQHRSRMRTPGSHFLRS